MFLSCASASPPPLWVQDLNAAFPGEKYLAASGRGKSREEAETAALAALGRFLESEVRSKTLAAERISEAEGRLKSERSIDSEVSVDSSVTLQFVRYIDPPWYNRPQKRYESAAWIEREEAFAQYEPRLRQFSDGFLAISAKAEKAAGESVWLQRAIFLQQAALYAGQKEFLETESFAQVIDSAKTGAIFAEARKKLASLPAELAEARRNAPVFVDCPTDFSEKAASAARQSLEKMGFVTSKAREGGGAGRGAVCRVLVSEGASTTDEGTFYYPLSAISLLDERGNALFSCEVSVPRQAAKSADVARNRAYAALAAAIEERMPAEYAESLAQAVGGGK